MNIIIFFYYVQKKRSASIVAQKRLTMSLHTFSGFRRLAHACSDLEKILSYTHAHTNSISTRPSDYHTTK